MDDEYAVTYEIRWSDLDANGHVNYSTYIDATADLRYRFFAEHGFPAEKFLEMGIGAVYVAIEARFYREVTVGETITIDYVLTGLSPKATRWKVRHDVLKANGKRAVSLAIEGTVLDLNSRRVVPLSPELMAIIERIPRAKQVEVMRDVRQLG